MQRLVTNRFNVNERIRKNLIKNENFLTNEELNLLIIESKRYLHSSKVNNKINLD